MPQVLESILSTYRARARSSQLEQIKRQGRKDAKALGDDAGPTHLSMGLQALDGEAAEAKGRYDAHYNERLRDLEETCTRLDEQIVQVYTEQERRLRDEKSQALMQLHKTFGPGSGSYDTLQKEETAAQLALDNKRASLDGRPPVFACVDSIFPLWVRWPF